MIVHKLDKIFKKYGKKLRYKLQKVTKEIL